MSTNTDPNQVLYQAATKALDALRQVSNETRVTGHGLSFPLTVKELSSALKRIDSLALPLASSLKCPHCLYTGEEETEHGGTFRYLVNTTVWRQVIETRPSKKKGEPPQTINVDGLSHIYGEEEETNDRIECRSCLKEFLLAKTIEVEFV